MTSFVQEAARRKKWMAGLVAGALAATVLTVGLAYWWSRARREMPLPAPQALPINIQNQASGYSFTRSIQGRQIFTIHAARTVAFKQGGSTVLQDVWVEFFGRDGNRHDLLRTGQCEYNPRSGDLSGPGEVEIELNAPRAGESRAASGPGRGKMPVDLVTSRLSFVRQGSLVETDEPVRFRVGQGTGSARGMKYATEDGWLELERDVALELGASGKAAAGAPPLRLTASRLRYDTRGGESGAVRLEGPIEIIQGKRRVLAARGTVALDSKNRVTGAVLEGNVQAFDSSGGSASDVSAGSVTEGRAARLRGELDRASGRLRNIVAAGGVWVEMRRSGRQPTTSRLEAQQVEMAFDGSPPKPQTGVATGDVKLALESPPGGGRDASRPAAGDKLEKKTLSAAQVRFQFRTGGKTLSAVETPGAGKLTLVPADPDQGEREITAGRFVMELDAQNRLEKLRGLPPTRMLFQPARNALAGSAPGVSTAERLEAAFDPATQTLSEVEQAGNFKLDEGDRQATAERARYSAANQTLTLIGKPALSDASSRMKAEQISYDLRTGTAEGAGKVQATHFASPGTRPAAPGAPGAPTHILAERLRAERRSQFVHYEGHVRAWQGSDVVASSSLDVSRTERRVSSGVGVVTSHYQPAIRAAAGAGAASSSTGRPGRGAEPRPVTIRADGLDFFDEGRMAAYHGNVQLQTGNTALGADRMEVYFSSPRAAAASEIQRAVADGHVTVTQPARRAAGEHADYDAEQGKIQLTGGPPTLYDAEKGSTTGQRLTFLVRDDRLFVDGGDQSPTLSQHRVAQ